MAAQQARSHSLWSPLVPFAIGGISGAVATLVIQPIDTLKVQVQIVSQQMGKSSRKQHGVFQIINRIRKDKGLGVLYRGLDSAILRQLFYTSARLGAYDASIQKLQTFKQAKASNAERTALSFASGVFGALVGTPFDVALIRRQASVTSGNNAYPNTWAAFKSILRKEGVKGLWSGLNITICRVVCINVAQLAGRDLISDALSGFNFASSTHSNIVALLASALTAVTSLPVDNIKVKLQKQERGEKVYQGIWDCLVKSIRNEGVTRLWVGFPIYFLRGTPHSFILIRMQLFLNQQWRQHQEQQ